MRPARETDSVARVPATFPEPYLNASDRQLKLEISSREERNTDWIENELPVLW